MIHTFTRAGMHLVLDTGSGAVHCMEAPAFELLQNITEAELRSKQLGAIPALLKEKYAAQELEKALKELSVLVAQNLLYSDDTYSEFEERLGSEPVKAMCLHMAHDCNLRCQYCFASTGDFGHGRKLMDFGTAKKAIDQLVRMSDGRHNLEVDFFGGEPMMNFDVLCKTVEYARSIEKAADKNFRFTVTTNGLTLNDDNIAYINKEMSNVVLSIDGRKDVNDRMRVRVDGTGSYDSIVPKFQKLVAGRGNKEYYVRGTYTRYNLDFDKDVLQLYDLGFNQISVEPVVGPETDDYSIREQDIPAIEASYERLMQQLIQRRIGGKGGKGGDFNFFHFMVDLDNGPCAIKRLKGCGSGNEYVAITPDGDMYPCHQFVGNTDFEMGTVDTGIERLDRKEAFAAANLFHKPTCQRCWAKFFCSGGCNANNHAFNGSIYTPHTVSCKLEVIRLECAIALQATVALANQKNP